MCARSVLGGHRVKRQRYKPKHVSVRHVYIAHCPPEKRREEKRREEKRREEKRREEKRREEKRREEKRREEKRREEKRREEKRREEKRREEKRREEKYKQDGKRDRHTRLSKQDWAVYAKKACKSVITDARAIMLKTDTRQKPNKTQDQKKKESDFYVKSCNSITITFLGSVRFYFYFYSGRNALNVSIHL